MALCHRPCGGRLPHPGLARNSKKRANAGCSLGAAEAMVTSGAPDAGAELMPAQAWQRRLKLRGGAMKGELAVQSHYMQSASLRPGEDSERQCAPTPSARRDGDDQGGHRHRRQNTEGLIPPGFLQQTENGLANISLAPSAGDD